MSPGTRSGQLISKFVKSEQIDHIFTWNFGELVLRAQKEFYRGEAALRSSELGISNSVHAQFVHVTNFEAVCQRNY